MRQIPRWVAGLVVLLLAGLSWLAVAGVTAPSVQPASAPADEFSGERAFEHVETIGTQVHVAGSAAAADVREYIVETLGDLGLVPLVQDAVGQTDALGGFAMARVRNIVAVIPGTASTGRIFLIAHYDSVQISYGGNDDGAGVATLLETARALTSGPPLRNDVVLVLTDAEEACLCGAEAFESQNALAADGGVVLNFESRGSTGPAIMFETTRGNADLVGLFASSVPYPVATSFAVEVYRILPNDTDFSPFRDSGRFTGLNNAYIDGSATYHTPQDRPSYMDVRSLQHLGSNALAMVAALGAADVAALGQPSAGDATYFPVPGLLIRYPGALVWPIAALALLAVLAVGWLALRAGVARIPGLAAGFGLALVPLVLGPVSAQLLWLLLTTIRPGYDNMIDPWFPGWFRAGVVALVATVLLTWYGLLRKRFGGWPLMIGALGWLAVLGVVLAAVTPGGSYLAAVPALFGAGGAAVALLVRSRWVGYAAQAVAGAVAVLVLAPTVQLFFPALGLALGAAPALFATLLGMVLLPVLDPFFAGPQPVGAEPAGPEPAEADSAGERAGSTRWLNAAPALVAAVLTVVCTAVGLGVDRFDAAHPAPVQLMYALDTDTAQAFWVRPGSDPSGWTDQYVSTELDLSGQFPMLPATATTGPAQLADLPPPAVDVVSDSAGAAGRTLTLRITPQRAVRLVQIELPGSTVLSVTAAGRDVPGRAADGPFELLFHAPPDDGLELTLVLADAGPATVRVMDGSDGLAGLPGFTPRPVGVGMLGSHTSELVLVAKNYTV